MRKGPTFYFWRHLRKKRSLFWGAAAATTTLSLFCFTILAKPAVFDYLDQGEQTTIPLDTHQPELGATHNHKTKDFKVSRDCLLFNP